MAILKPDKTVTTDSGLKVNEYLLTTHNPNKIDMPVKRSASQPLIGVTLHNTEWIKVAAGTTPAEQYVRATYNGNMGTVRVHYFVDDKCAWKALDDAYTSWHAATGGQGLGNCNTISIECIMRNKTDAESLASMENAAKLIAWIFKQYGWTIEKNLYTHNYWTNYKATGKCSTDLDAQSLKRVSTTAKCFNSSEYANKSGKYCPVFILPQWEKFKALVKKYMVTAAQTPTVQKTVDFTPRLTAPSTTDKHFLHTSKGGLNECIHISGGSCLPNCVGYAWGRFYEIIGTKPALSKCNAEMWYGNTADGYKRSSTPALGAVACWSKGVVGNGADGAGHVAIVERIEVNGDIVTSNSAYGGTRFYTQTYRKSAGYNFGAYKFQGFILPPVQIKETSSSVIPTAGGVKVGDVVNFTGTTHYGSSTGTRGTAAKPGKAKVTNIAAGAAHPYHLINDGSGSTVYGWVNAADVSTASTAAQIKVGSTVKLRSGANDYNGGKLAAFVYTRPHIVSELKGDRAVITFRGVVVAAVKTSDLTLA
ncbi:MAG: N-acetylmuramoyl-L-alanine amidase [Oscillospiraceae bacterium]|nr:N-acetylmuramoyl-L-alanine amidase [Oscillospiraceae bacterium]